VQYVDALRSADYLNIVLEYMESGALSGLLSKMGGKLPEQLTAIYTAQVDSCYRYERVMIYLLNSSVDVRE
jgi:serine/threonine protein kinase